MIKFLAILLILFIGCGKPTVTVNTYSYVEKIILDEYRQPVIFVRKDDMSIERITHYVNSAKYIIDVPFGKNMWMTQKITENLYGIEYQTEIHIRDLKDIEGLQ